MARFNFDSIPRLSCIFFVGRGKTLTHSAPLPLVIAVSVVGAGLMAWGILGTVILYLAKSRLTNMEQELHQARGEVFELQVRYEKVFETAYPVQRPTLGAERTLAQTVEALTGAQGPKPLVLAPVPAAKAQAKPLATVANTAESGERPAPEAAVPAPETGSSKALAVKAPSMPQEPKPEPSREQLAADLESALAIKELKVEQNSQGLELNFTLKNQGSKSERGFIWVVAQYQDREGVKMVAVPEGAATALPAPSEALQAAERFKVRIQRLSRFHLPRPEGEGQFYNATIYVTDLSGKLLNKVEVKVPQEKKAVPPKYSALDNTRVM